MELRDLIVTPIVIFLVFGAAYFLRPYFTDSVTRRYFIPALAVRVAGALALGFIYQFYYDGGDTFNFHTHGSRHVWEAFTEDPDKGVRLFLRDEDQRGLYRYSSKIPFYKDESSYSVIRVSALIDFFTYSTYSATAVVFSVMSFVGLWLFFQTFYRHYPHLHLQLAVGILFVPSVFFWGSGLLKDTLTLSCAGAATYAINRIFIERRLSFSSMLLLLLAGYGLYHIKIYILLVLLPASILWVFLQNYSKIPSRMLKMMLFPVVILGSGLMAYYALVKAGEGNEKYSLEVLAKTAQITAYDIRYYTGKDAGSGYSLGELDGTWESMVNLVPQAINVSLFRPYLWEVRNPLMLLSALESLVLLVITIVVLVRSIRRGFGWVGSPTIIFCLAFSLTFAFAVGISTYNFGSLTRYKIPLLPFYCVALILIWDYSNKLKKTERLTLTE